MLILPELQFADGTANHSYFFSALLSRVPLHIYLFNLFPVGFKSLEITSMAMDFPVEALCPVEAPWPDVTALL